MGREWEEEKGRGEGEQKKAIALACPICGDAYLDCPRKMMLVPSCGHALCGDCIAKIAECPFCRKRIGDPRRVFLTWQ